MLPILVVFAAVHLATSINQSRIDVAVQSLEQQKQILCGLGCKCPEKGQIRTFLDCGRQGISQLPLHVVIDPTVTSVSFESNHLSLLRTNTFFRAEEVQDLDISLNALSGIENYAFAPFMSLTHLKLSHNRLSVVGRDLLDGLWNLRVLELGHNLIQNLDPRSFEVTPNLQELRLQYNPLFELGENVFSFLPRLEKLDLQETGLVDLPEYVFRDNPRLHWLSLSKNAFENVPDHALSHATQLEILDLSENDFTVLVEGAFKGLSNLTVLYLNNLDRLSRIEKNALAGLDKLKGFFCSYNSKLNYIDEDVFGSGYSNTSVIKTPPRERIYLRQNALKTLKSPLEEQSWSTLTFVDLADNPWRCDCNLLWMTQLTQEAQGNIRCDSPRNLRGRTFDTIDPSELRCDSNWGIATFALVIACMVGFGAIMLAVSATVCSRTPIGLYVRAKQQFSYDKVKPKIETVDLEWDPSAEI